MPGPSCRLVLRQRCPWPRGGVRAAAAPREQPVPTRVLTPNPLPAHTAPRSQPCPTSRCPFMSTSQTPLLAHIHVPLTSMPCLPLVFAPTSHTPRPPRIHVPPPAARSCPHPTHVPRVHPPAARNGVTSFHTHGFFPVPSSPPVPSVPAHAGVAPAGPPAWPLMSPSTMDMSPRQGTAHSGGTLHPKPTPAQARVPRSTQHREMGHLGTFQASRAHTHKGPTPPPDPITRPQ